MYELWLFLHVLSAIVAFGAFFAAPAVTREAGDGAEDARRGFAKVAIYVQAPALALLLFSGIMRAYEMESPAREIFAETWVSIAFTVWTVMAVVLFFLIRAQRRGSSAVQSLQGAMHLLLVVALFAMIWQPGAPG
jgi:cytochrome bd-type quinol oxidase subunit 2